jgi:hypothetical protein
MLVHQQTCVPTTRIVSLGFAKGMAMEVEGWIRHCTLNGQTKSNNGERKVC